MRRFHRSRKHLRNCALALLLLPWLPLSSPLAATTPSNAVSAKDLNRYRRMADQMYKATSSDARTFRRALQLPELRKSLEHVFKKPLSDNDLRAMAAHAEAEADYWKRYLKGLGEQAPGGEMSRSGTRRIPGKPPVSSGVPPLANPDAVPPPVPFETGGYLPVPDRWRILDALGRKENPLDPYNTNTLKGDKPIFGDDWFFEVGAIADTLYEPSRVPLGVAFAASARPREDNTFGRYGRTLFSETDILSLSLIKGDTAFKPPDWEFRLTPVFNFNHTSVGELGVININPERGQTRDDSFPGLQEAFVEYHIRNVSEYYDFDSLKAGIQPFNADFRGFLFQDNDLGLRFFGDRDANRWQYNLAYFRRIEKDTNSGLNDVGKSLRNDNIFVANLYRQDFPVHGFTSQIVDLFNMNREGDQKYYDNNGFLVRPAQIGDNRGYNYDVNYLGLNGDGHFGRLNLTFSGYWAFGDLSHNQFGTNPQNHGGNINAFFLAAEPSMDFDWIRVRLSGLYASGDDNPRNGHATGFDAPFENPQFAGADTSYWIRQTLPFIGGGVVGVNTLNGVLADLRAAKGEGQSNFINPGIMLAGIGGDFDILPELRVSTNFNYLRFANTATLQLLRNQGTVPNSIGYDASIALTYRPLFTQNVVFRLSGAALFPGDGLKAIYNEQGANQLFGSGNFLYTVLANVILTY